MVKKYVLHLKSDIDNEDGAKSSLNYKDENGFEYYMYEVVSPVNKPRNTKADHEI